MAKQVARARRPGFWGRLRTHVPEGVEEKLAQVLLRALLVVFIVVAGYLLVLEMKSYLMGLERFQVSPATLTFPQLPDWVTPEIRQQLSVIPGIPDDDHFSIMEPGLTDRLAQAYAANPWVKKVHLVERHFPNRLKLELTLRRPAAVVHHGGSYYLTDEEGVRLPVRLRSWPSRDFQLPLVTGAAVAPPRSGKPWDEEAVEAGCAVAQLLKVQGLDRRLSVTAVDVSNFSGRRRPGEPDIVLRTAFGLSISWGRSPLQWYPGDGSQTVRRKLLYLDELVKREDLRRLERADVRFDRLMIVRRSL